MTNACNYTLFSPRESKEVGKELFEAVFGNEVFL
jgi:hypothetical protein